MTVDNLDNEIGVRYIFVDVKVDDFTFVFGVVDLFFHHALAYCSHLRAAVGIDDGSDDVAAERRTNLIEQVGIFLACLGIFVIADFERCAVGGKTAVETR